MSRNRSIEELRHQFGGAIYVILKGNNIEDRFLPMPKMKVIVLVIYVLLKIREVM